MFGTMSSWEKELNPNEMIEKADAHVKATHRQATGKFYSKAILVARLDAKSFWLPKASTHEYYYFVRLAYKLRSTSDTTYYRYLEFG
jgi:hypothetical protein